MSVPSTTVAAVDTGTRGDLPRNFRWFGTPWDGFITSVGTQIAPRALFVPRGFLARMQRLASIWEKSTEKLGEE